MSRFRSRLRRRHGVCESRPLLAAPHERPRAAIWCAIAFGQSPLYNGQIQGIGPRYCPSLEDKIMRFPERERHQIYLEPEGLDVDEIYVNGFSMSLPREVQEYARSRAARSRETRVMLRPGYAVEYDFVQPTELNVHARNAPSRRALFFAGQINGTSGYEEAAAQGIVAGINAARRSARRVRVCAWPRSRRTSAFSSTISSREAVSSHIGCSLRAPSIACCFESTTPTCG